MYSQAELSLWEAARDLQLSVQYHSLGQLSGVRAAPTLALGKGDPEIWCSHQEKGPLQCARSSSSLPLLFTASVLPSQPDLDTVSTVQ